MRTLAMLGLAILMVTVGCSRKSREALASTAKHKAGKVARAIVDAAFDDTQVQPSDPATARRILGDKLGNTNILGVANIQGVWVEGAMLSYGYFVYDANEKDLLSAIATAPFDSSFQLQSDSACKEANWADSKESLTYKLGPQGNLPGWKPEDVVEKRCYTCLRCPWAHTILIDGKTGKVYHSISEVRE